MFEYPVNPPATDKDKARDQLLIEMAHAMSCLLKHANNSLFIRDEIREDLIKAVTDFMLVVDE